MLLGIIGILHLLKKLLSFQNLSLDEAAGLKKQAETVVVEMMAKTTNINGSWNRHSVVSSFSYQLLS